MRIAVSDRTSLVVRIEGCDGADSFGCNLDISDRRHGTNPFCRRILGLERLMQTVFGNQILNLCKLKPKILELFQYRSQTGPQLCTPNYLVWSLGILTLGIDLIANILFFLL